MKNIIINLGKWFVSSSAYALTLIEEELYFYEHGRRRATLQEQLELILANRTVPAQQAKINFEKKKVN